MGTSDLWEGHRRPKDQRREGGDSWTENGERARESTDPQNRARDKESKVPPDKEGCDDRVFVHLIIHTPTTIQGGREHYELLPKLWNSPFSRKRGEEDRRVG